MEVILIENIEKLGKIGDVVRVKDGYARNYLLPRKKVLRSNEENRKIFEEKKAFIESEEKKRREKSIQIAKKIKDMEFTLIRSASENDQLYGSVTSKDIIKEIKIIKEIDLFNDQINLKKLIKILGVHEIEISIYTDIKEKILVNVAKTKESGIQQLKEYKNPKKEKVVKSKIKTKKLKKTEVNEKDKELKKNIDEKNQKELSTKDLVKEIEKKNLKESKTTKINKKIKKIKEIKKKK